MIGIPFFNSKISLDAQLDDILASIISVFSILFLCLLGLSYVASENLTQPLRMISKKLGATNLNSLDEKLEWKSDDEIGMLVGSYNKMLGSLDKSKRNFGIQEREEAWDELVRQMVHEIKNPLTPIKFSIQGLEMRMKKYNESSLDPTLRYEFENKLKAINEQVDNINNIITAYSDKGNITAPTKERFDLVSMVQNSINIHTDNQKISIFTRILVSKVFINGDRQQLSRGITNLIINGIQSVPESRRPVIEVRVFTKENKKVIIEVEDNGNGIDEDIRNKIFLSKFSTKKSSGVGLWFVKRAVELANGNISYETRIGEGTTFMIDLPIVQEKE